MMGKHWSPDSDVFDSILHAASSTRSMITILIYKIYPFLPKSNITILLLMNRRQSLKSLFLATGGLVALPSWADGWSVKNINHLSSFNNTEQEILTSVVDTIIPHGYSIGALSVGVDKFLQKLIDNCYDITVQDNVKKQLAALNANAQSAY